MEVSLSQSGEIMSAVTLFNNVGRCFYLCAASGLVQEEEGEAEWPLLRRRGEVLLPGG